MDDNKASNWCSGWWGRIPRWVAVALAIVVAVAVAKNISPKPVDRVVSVTATAKSLVKPDKAQVRIGVVTPPQKTAAEAVTQGNQQMQKVTDALKAVGVKAEEMQTTGYNLNPHYTYEPNTGTQKLDGYELRQELQVKVGIGDADKISNVLGAATGAGANTVSDIQFVVDDPDMARTGARNEAIQKAKVKAKNLARATGMHLGRIVDVLEDQGYTEPPIMYARDMALGMGGSKEAATPAPAVEVGQNEIAVTVTLVYLVR
jgi:uncharacterized protein YggE